MYQDTKHWGLTTLSYSFCKIWRAKTNVNDLNKNLAFLSTKIQTSQGEMCMQYLYIMYVNVCDLGALKHKKLPHKIKLTFRKENWTA